MVDLAYTADDHAFRESDDYAQAKYNITLRWLGPARGRRLLNIGCGAGLFNELAYRAGFVVEACEPDSAAYARAVAAAPRDVVVHLGGLFDAPMSPGADVVVMHDVLEHIEDEAVAVSELRRLVRTGGTVVLSVPALTWLFGAHDERLGHCRRYTRKSLRSVLEGEFQLRRMRYFGFTLIPVTLWFSRWRRRPYPTATAAGGSFIGRAFSFLCRIETSVPAPIGTALLCEATLRATVHRGTAR